MAGSWKSSLITALSWTIRHNWYPDPISIQDRRRPTWSWASYNGPVDFETFHDSTVYDSHFKLIDTALQFSAGHVNDFSPVVGGFITIVGRLTEVEYDGMFIRHQGYEGFGNMDYPAEHLTSKRIPALFLGQKDESTSDDDTDWFLLLEPCGTKGSAFVRIGFGTVNFVKCRTRKQRMANAAQRRASWKQQILHLC